MTCEGAEYVYWKKRYEEALLDHKKSLSGFTNLCKKNFSWMFQTENDL